MALCPKCGSQVTEGLKFCGACGSPIGAAANASAVPPPSLSPAGPPPPASQGGMTPNIAAMLTYLPLCFIGLVCAVLFGFVLDPYKKDGYIRFHAWQSLAVHAAFIVFWIGWMIFTMLLTAITHIFAIVTIPVSMLLGVGALVLMVVLMVKAYGNQAYKLPGIGDWAEKQSMAKPTT